MRPDISKELLIELLDYRPGTGDFFWKERSIKYFPTENVRNLWNSQFAGKKAGHRMAGGYWVIGLFNKPHYAHRLAWIIEYGVVPSYVDHINHNRDDNRIENLRSVSRMENEKNQRLSSRNKSGICGVSWVKRDGNWQTYINIYKCRITLGNFYDFFQACCARKRAEVRFGYHANHGKPAP